MQCPKCGSEMIITTPLNKSAISSPKYNICVDCGEQFDNYN